jgi:hypothetical protein
MSLNHFSGGYPSWKIFGSEANGMGGIFNGGGV